MGSFVIYVIVVTFIFVIYYVVMICLDLFGGKGEKKDSVEVIHAGAPMADSAPSVTSPVKVNEEEGGTFSMNNPNGKQEEYGAGHQEPSSSSAASVPPAVSEQAPLSAADIIGSDDEELFAQSKAKVEEIKENLDTVPPSIQGAVYIDGFQDIFKEALEKARYEQEQAEQLSF